MPLLVTENYGRGRTAVFATSGSWRWKMWQDHTDVTHATFWQQLMRYLVTDSPGQVTASTPRAGALRRNQGAAARGGARQGVQAGDQRKVQAHFVGPDGALRQRGLTPQPLEEGVTRPNGRGKAGLVRGRDHRRTRAGRIGPRRADLPPRRWRGGELPHLAESRAAGEAGRADRRPILQPRRTRPSWRRDFVFGSGHHHARDQGPLGYAGGFPAGAVVARSEWLLRPRWGVVYEAPTAAASQAARWGRLNCWPARLQGLPHGRRLTALPLPATYYVTISGLGGEPDYDQRFKMWAKRHRFQPEEGRRRFQRRNAGRAHARTDPRALRRIAKRPSPRRLVVMLIGHGSFDGVEYKFNIPGPDITASELATLLDRVPATRQLVVNMTSSSGGSIEFLRKPNRVVIAATKNGTEKNATVFARYWAEALRDPAADSDKNESVSALEAFRLRAARRRCRVLRSQKRLATEHAVLEDTGKGDGVRTPIARKRRRDAGRSIPAGAHGRQAAAAQRPGQARAARQERAVGTGHRQAEIRQGRHPAGRL
jgi:hypothetical protein